MKKLDCLLIAPPNFYKKESVWGRVGAKFPPLGLASIASYVRDKGFTVDIIDCEIVAPSVEHFQNYMLNYLKKLKQVRFIGITAVTPNVKKAYKLAEVCKRMCPCAKIVFGGVHATFATDEVISNEYVDYVVVGEGEITMSALLLGKRLHQIDGLVFKKNDQIIKNAPRRRIKNIDDLPMPAYDLLPVLKYRPAKGTFKRLPAINILTSRGCPRKCTFCSKPLGDYFVFKSADNIFKEVQYLIKNYGVKQLMFYDDTFTANKENVVKLCQLFIKNKTNLLWTCFARVDFIDYELLKIMKKAGCNQVMYGVESVDEIVLKNINKKIDVRQVINAVRWTKSAGIECRLTFMVGNIGDTKEIISKNIQFVNKVSPDLLMVSITTPFPGTELFKWAESRNAILSRDWDDYDFSKQIIKSETMSEADIKKYYKLMYRKFYFRPRYVLQRLKNVSSFADFKLLFDGLTSVFYFSLSK